MRSRSTSDVIYTAIAWTPLLVLLVGSVLALCTGVLWLETYSEGTSHFIQQEGSYTPFTPERAQEMQDLHSDVTFVG